MKLTWEELLLELGHMLFPGGVGSSPYCGFKLWLRFPLSFLPGDLGLTSRLWQQLVSELDLHLIHRSIWSTEQIHLLRRLPLSFSLLCAQMCMLYFRNSSSETCYAKEQCPVSEKTSSIGMMGGSGHWPLSFQVSSKILELARKQRMNTDVRRNIFCTIMTSEDFLDAFEKLLK